VHRRIALLADEQLLLMFLTVAIATTHAVRTPPRLLNNADVALMTLQTFVMKVLVAFGAVEELHPI
jgi:hypothetical protein